MRVRPILPLLVLACGLALAVAGDTRAAKAIGDYRYFRALSIDLVGRPPTRDELAQFEANGFSVDSWLDTHLTGPLYAERLRRIYMDTLRLEVGPSFQFVPNALVLRRQQIVGPDGEATFVYWRRGQRRVDPATDGDFCLSPDDTGQQYPNNAAPTGTPKPVSKSVLDARTVVVKPWWLYADYRDATPADRVGADWAKRFPGFVLAPPLLVEPDNKTPTLSVRVCREEAQTTETGVVYASGRGAAKKGDALPGNRLTQPPGDSGFAKQNKGRAVSCLAGVGVQTSVDCGCGIGLERCVPAAGVQNEPPSFVMPTHTPLGLGAPFEASPQPPGAWERMWWGEEARHFFDKIFIDDRDVRELLTSRATMVNGPLAQFYRFMASATCCGQSENLGYSEPEPLVEPGAIPSALVPEDTATWLPVADRGPHASGILTMPIFLTKYGSRRARAHVIYSAFLCKDFVADTVKLEPSSEPDLTKRPGCSTCHHTLEPMAAYFTRVAESDWTYLPATQLPLQRDCKNGPCKSYYDPAFGNSLRGAYAAPSHAEAGPAGFAQEVANAPEFASCVVQHVAQSLLGRSLAAEDDAWKTSLVKTFVDGGYRMRALVKAVVTSPRYRDGNDVASHLLRAGDP